MALPASDIPIVLLAAGAASRMRGRDKLLEEVDSIPLLRRQALLAQSVTRGKVIVTLPPAPHPRYRMVDGLDVTTVGVADAAEGMGASLRAGVRSVPSTAPCAMIFLADLPALTHADLALLLGSVDVSTKTRIWRGTSARGVPGHPIVIHAVLFPEFMQLAGDTGGREVLKSNAHRTEFVPLTNDHAILDLDTPEEWAAWRARAQQL